MGAFVVARDQIKGDPGAGDFIQRSIGSFCDGRAYPGMIEEVPAVNHQVHFLLAGKLQNLQIVLKQILSPPPPFNPGPAGKVISQVGISKKQDLDYFSHNLNGQE